MDEVIPIKKKPGRPSKASLLPEAPLKPKLPRVSVLDRRLRSPFGTSSVPITLKTPGHWEVRWVFAQLRPGRLYDMTQNKGWAFITPEELDGSPDEYGLIAKDGRLVRGEHGGEVLMKMPKDMYDQISEAKSRANLKGLGKSAMRETAAQATAVEHGSQAGDEVFNAFDRINVTDSKGVDLDLETETS